MRSAILAPGATLPSAFNPTKRKNNMIDEKPWYMSKTIWGSLVAVAAALASTAGFTIDGESQLAISEAILQVVVAAGALFSIYGRLSATDIIS